jgi:hypothetical protein
VSDESAGRRGWRIAAAAALIGWLAPAVWLLIKVINGDARYQGAHPLAKHGLPTALGQLLLPALLLATLALVLLLVRRRATFAWTVVFLLALLGVPAWLVLRDPAYRPVGRVPHDVVASIVWMVLGLVVYLLVLSLLMLRGQPAPADVHLSQQFMGAPGMLHTNTPTGSEPLIDREPHDPHES